MIILKEVKRYIPTNSVEATWVDRTQPADIEVPAVDAVLDEEGNIVSPAVAAHSITPEPTEVQAKCHSYADVQMDMLRADLGADAAAYADLIAEVEANIKPIPPAPVIPYTELRAAAYPPVADYLDAWVKNDAVALEKYRSDCLAVKAKYPKS